ncbi:MAG: tail fiber domain-containing protein [Flavobacteriales bacterium]|nr:tail fiber domain-containing protein [Flavobacteriales bacterium]
MLHLDDAGSNSAGFRPWMRQGTLVTHQSDFSYFGMKDEGSAQNHTVVAWSDNDIWDPGPDYMKFIFTSYSNQNGAAGTLDGLEAARFVPDATGDEVYLGVGDWFNAGTNPTERLDLLDGRARIRELPNDPSANALTKIMVVDDTPGPEFGVVKWRDISTLVDCDWATNGFNDIYTAFDPAPPGTCPGALNNVGIGMDLPKAKLHVVEDTPLPMSEDRAIFAHILGDEEQNVAVDALAPSPEAAVNIGMRSWAQDGRVNYGLYAHTTVTPPYAIQTNVGVYGNAEELGNASIGGYAQSCIGIWGRARCSTANNWAGYFEGDVLATGNYYTSDATLKTNVEPITDPGSVLDQLQPVSYFFDTVTYDFMGLPKELQFGLIAQDVETVLPHLVKDVVRPAEYDSMGVITQDEFMFKALNYTELIPLLIGSIKEQKAAVAQLTDQVDQLQQDLASCCEAHDGTLDGRGMQQDGTGNGSDLEQGVSKSNDRLSIMPNPFQERTTLSYLLDAPAMVQLQVSTEHGLHLATLRNQQHDAGAYSMTWDTQDLAPGIYFVSLFADGRPVVKKAVKVK